MIIKYFELVNDILTIILENSGTKKVSFNELERFYNRNESKIKTINVNKEKYSYDCFDIWELQNVVNN